LRLTITDRQRVQVALTSLGLDTRSIDGAFGPRSREKIAGWQKARNRSPNGFLSGPEKPALLNEAAPAIAKFDDEQKKIEDEKKKAADEAKVAAAAAAAAREKQQTEQPLNGLLNQTPAPTTAAIAPSEDLRYGPTTTRPFAPAKVAEGIAHLACFRAASRPMRNHVRILALPRRRWARVLGDRTRKARD
jgi:peptidoglycan hydrolase-like protein with peptidoglycan-binding domain